jgi:cytochrome c peroxidase
MQGDASALTVEEQRGAGLFVGKAGCVSCHSGPFLSDQRFHNVGLVPAIVVAEFITRDDPGAERGLAQVMADPLNVQGEFADGDDGRLPVAVPEGMLGAFRTPMLRCGSGHPSFMRTAQLTSLRDVVEFFNQGGLAPVGEPPPPDYLGSSELLPLGLTDAEVDDLVAFLEALDGPGPEASLLAAPGE